jgi:uncharacterized low-complexity protein
MSNKANLKPMALALGTAFASTLGMGAVSAEENPFSMTELSSGYKVASSHEGKCGEAKCGAQNKAEKADKEGNCGAQNKAQKQEREGNCGAQNKAQKADKEGNCGGAKKQKQESEGKCGSMN